MLASYLYYAKGNTKLNRQNYTLKNNPLGLVLWQGRVKMRSGLTLPKSSAKCNPLGLVFQIIRISAYNQAIIAGFVGSAEMLTFAYARARSALGLIIHQLNLYHND